ncbi:MAG: DNA repair protein RecN [Flavobacteriaceae bacterium]
MLSKITIQNFALIDSLHISLNNGLQVITGETGAGKSIILGALRLVLGERADVKAISNPENKSVVETEFRIDKQHISFFEENDLDFEENTIIRREILPSGKSRAFINDVPVTLDVLKELSSKLIDIHSQFETSDLFSEEYQFKIIDGLSENKLLISAYQQDFNTYQKLNKTLQELKNQLENSNKEADYQNFLLSELEEIDLESIDLEELKNQVSIGENAGNIIENLNYISGRFYQEEIGVLDGLNDIKNKIQKIAENSPHFEELSKRLDEAHLELKDIHNQIENELEKVEIDPESLAAMTALLNKINTLFLKHQVSDIEGLIEIKNQLSSQQKNSQDLEKNIIDIENQLSQLTEKLNVLASDISKNRKSAIPVFTEKIEKILKKLGLEKAKIEVELTDNENFNKFGKEHIQLLFQANTGFPLKPIQNAISGGERSRVMLSIKKIIAENTELPTLILDEIDTGVSGKVANEIGNVMQEMAENMQLIVITHLAQVAAKGSNNYKVIKEDVHGKTQSTIIPLNEEQKLQEIAQLLSGDTITDAAIQQAKELINK